MPVVLLLAASPIDQDRLRLSQEVKGIKEALQRSRNRENWRIESNEAATVDDLRRALLDYQPTIVHFCGHGAGDGGLCFENNEGQTHPTHAAPLARLFHALKDNVKCVVLNACYSEVQGEMIRQQIDYVVGMRKAIGDEAAIRFAVAFYDAVFAGVDFRKAFDLGCTTIDLHNLPDTDVPAFLTSPQLGGITLDYTEVIPEIEDLLHAYLNTPYAERHRFTTKGEQLVDAMKQYYGDRMLLPVGAVQFLTKRIIDDHHWKVLARLEGTSGKGSYDYYIQIKDRSVRIDWEATVGYWSMPVKTYLAFGTASDIVARVSAELGNVYLGPFHGEERTFQHVRLTTIDKASLYGYIHCDNPSHKELMDILGDGNSHDITLGINGARGAAEYPNIMKLLSRSWILPEGPTAPQG